jgi:hypothetical protein
MPMFKIYSTRVQKVCAVVYAKDDDHIDDALLDVTPDEWEVIGTIEPEEVEQYFAVNRNEYLEDINEN